MYFENRLTDADLQRAHDISPNPPPAMLMAGSFCALLEAIEGESRFQDDASESLRQPRDRRAIRALSTVRPSALEAFSEGRFEESPTISRLFVVLNAEMVDFLTVSPKIESYADVNAP
jgi:hypothetical protein